MRTPEPDPWRGVDDHYGANDEPIACARCGDETYQPEELCDGLLYCPECAEPAGRDLAADTQDAGEMELASFLDSLREITKP